MTTTTTDTPGTPAESATEPKVVPGSDGLLIEVDGHVVPNYDATFTHFNEGEVVSGRVVRIDKDEVLVDIGYKSEGVIPSSELSIRKNVDPNDEVELGEEVDALVLTKEDQDGRLIMSKKRARFEKAWRRIEAAAESGQPVEGTVIEVVKGGLIIDLGVRGFLPASLVDIRRVANLDEFLHTKIECKVIELNRARNNVVLSRRAVLEEERKEQRQEILDRLQPGLVVEGQISNIVDFGAFVDLNGIDGLIHISELSWSHVNHPSEILSIGDTVQVKVLDIDRDRQRISLGLKQTQEDPWQRVVDTYHVGDDLEGKVTKVVTFGAFVEILDGVEGLVHISELAPHHVENPREIVQPGDTVKVKILEIDSERRRLSLSVKRVEGQILSAHTGDLEPVGAGNLDDLPELGLSDDVFAGSAAEAEVAAPEAEAAAPEAEAEAAAPEVEAEAAAPEAPQAGTAEASEPAGDAVEAPAEPVEAPAEQVEAPAEPVEAPAETEQA
ncbi:MAG TPA: 30S ribosomal protein S1 [Solirubrobacteraceae bacterium]|nr:30S ribosomal protein S1 [Solirubrobacteraceae bacterium]